MMLTQHDLHLDLVGQRSRSFQGQIDKIPNIPHFLTTFSISIWLIVMTLYVRLSSVRGPFPWGCQTILNQPWPLRSKVKVIWKWNRSKIHFCSFWSPSTYQSDLWLWPNKYSALTLKFKGHGQFKVISMSNRSKNKFSLFYPFQHISLVYNFDQTRSSPWSWRSKVKVISRSNR